MAPASVIVLRGKWNIALDWLARAQGYHRNRDGKQNRDYGEMGGG